jgi:hypothetical protein
MIVLNSNDDFGDMQPCRKKPIVVFATQINEDFCVNTLEGLMKGYAGDYLIRDIRGEIYPCEKSIFEDTYVWVKDEQI